MTDFIISLSVHWNHLNVQCPPSCVFRGTDTLPSALHCSLEIIKFNEIWERYIEIFLSQTAQNVILRTITLKKFMKWGQLVFQLVDIPNNSIYMTKLSAGQRNWTRSNFKSLISRNELYYSIVRLCVFRLEF